MSRFYVIFVCLTVFMVIFTMGNYSVFALENTQIKVVYEDKSWVFDLGECNSDNFIIQNQYQERKQLIEKMGVKNAIYKLNGLGFDYDEIINYLLPGFDKFINKIARDVEKDTTQHKIFFNSKSKNMFRFEEGKRGVRVNKTKLIEEVLFGDQKLINLSVDYKDCDFDFEKLKRATILRSKECTSFKNSEQGRKHNLIKAIKSFDGKVVMPEEIVSFNKVTGSKSIENGYREAIIIVNGEFVKGLGGGVCQASTTLYNTVLMAGLKIMQVHRHSLPVHYVELGFDAMVNDAGADMKFCNDTGYPIYIKTYAENDCVWVEVYGLDMGGVQYKKLSKTVSIIEPESPKVIPDLDKKHVDHIRYEGEYFTERYAQNGYEVDAYLEKYINGELAATKKIRHEKYLSQQSIIYEGVEKREFLN